MSIEGFPHTTSGPDKPDKVATQVEKLSSFEVSGDAIADGKRFDEISNDGRLASVFTDKDMSLRTMLAMKDRILRHDPMSDVVEANPEIALKAIDRILSHYGVTAANVREFDEQLLRREDEPLTQTIRAFERFEITGDVEADARKLFTIRNLAREVTFGHRDNYNLEHLDSGKKDVVTLLQEHLEFLNTCISRGTGGEVPRTAYLLGEVFPKEREIVLKILAEASNS